jgi:uroporphyrinogen-III synthase
LKIKSILVSQPKPADFEKSPYYALSNKFKLKVDFRKFIKVEGVSSKEFRKQKVSILDHTAIILSSRNAVDHFFRLAKELRIEIPDTMKYFCVSEAIAFYLQNYIQYRKRKVFSAGKNFSDLIKLMQKHKTEKYLLLCTDIMKKEIEDQFKKAHFNYSKAVIYNTVCSDLSDLKDITYDMLVFYSPLGIKSLFQNFPDFKQNDTIIAAFGPATKKAIKEAKLTLNVEAPTKKAPSMTKAIADYIEEQEKNLKKQKKTKQPTK